MKKFILLISFLFLNSTLVLADDIAIQTFQVDVDNSVAIVTTGTLATIFNTSTGVLGTALSINYNITTNQSLTDIGLRALIRSSSSTESAFYCTGSGPTSSQAMHLVFSNNDQLPTVAAINNCKQPTSTVASNRNAIAYPGTVAISGTGTVSYQPTGYFACQIPSGTSNLNMSITTTPKSGTYSTLDTQGVYQVEVYLDNIPS